MYPLEFVRLPVLSGRYRPLLQKVAKCKKYNKFKDFAFNTLAFQKVTNMTFKYSNFRALKSVNPKSSGGSAPGPPAGALLSESILKQLIKYLFYTFLLLFHSKSQHGLSNKF